MKFERWKAKPKAVQEAAQDGNKRLLSEMGKKGAQVANEKQALQKDMEELQSERLAEKREQEERERIRSANEHIIDSDGNDLDYSDDR